ncbi:iron-sulfur cluster assembly scaffold protein [Candidatus Peregrinibacteria bacterium]|nr:iron-sulfur cluster assembly scaffold protein [Candidatus Peregrinibacteria bacterium]
MQGQIIYDYGKNPVNYGVLENPTIRYIEKNHTCGEFMVVYILLEKGMVKEIAFEGDGRMVGIAAMSLLTERIEDQPLEEIEKIDKEEILEMLEVKSLSLKRLKSAMLGLLTIKNAYRTFQEKELLDFADILNEQDEV